MDNGKTYEELNPIERSIVQSKEIYDQKVIDLYTQISTYSQPFLQMIQLTTPIETFKTGERLVRKSRWGLINELKKLMQWLKIN
jgi:UDP-N-acetyl-D-mannosaminuronate dehydrogenase